ncbi:MAG: hypothetical protein RIS82_759 [Actinomycetota bacterium]
MNPPNFQRFWIFAIAAGLAIGNLYVAHPLLVEISEALAISSPQVGLMATLVQVGYAVGTVMLLPLGDLLSRKHLVPVFMATAGLGLFIAGLSESFTLLLITLAAVGLTTISGQMLIALTGDVSGPEKRGRNLGVVASGIVVGILVARTISGVIAGLLGWHASFLAFGILNILVGLLLFRLIPRLQPKPRVAYFKLISDVFVIPLKNWTLALNLFMNSVGFALFSAMWTSITFLLSEKPFEFNPEVIGLFGLVGVVGALVAQPAGKLFDRGLVNLALIFAFAGYVVSYILGGFVFVSIGFLIAQLLLLDAAGQVNNLMNQSRVLTKFAHARSRVNASYVASNFVGGAIGTSVAASLWPIGGWILIQQISLAISLALLAAWVIIAKTKLFDRPANY